MADYWKSNPRKYCEVCKCWFGDNKASVDFHERGRRHKENAKKLLSSARQRTAENEKEAAKTNEMLATIEIAAAAAYVKDLEGDQEGSSTSKKRPKPHPIPTPPPQPEIEVPFQLRKAKAHLEILDAIQKRQEKTEREAAKREKESGPPPPPPSQWQQAATPDGQMYYYNIFTRETQWEQPPDFLPVPPTPAARQPSSDTAQPTFIHAGSEEEEEQGKKRLLEMAFESSAKRPTGPYGAWTTIAVHPRQPEAVAEKETESESSDGDLDSEEEREDKDEEEKLSFKERTVNPLPPPQEEGGANGDPVTVGSFQGFGFKKRSTAARPQIRQRTSELS